MGHTNIERAAQAALFQSRSKVGEPPIIGDLFCGAGVFSLAAESLGMVTAYAYEPDERARTAYAANVGTVPHGYIGEGFTPDNLPPETLDLLMCRFPKDTAEFDQVALRFLRYCQPRAVMFVSPSRRTISVGSDGRDILERESDDAQVIAHVSRRAGFLNYVVESHLFAPPSEEGNRVQKHWILVGIQRKQVAGSYDFPWDEASDRIHFEPVTLPGGWASVDTPDAVTPTAARALLGTLAQFVLGVGTGRA